MRSTMTDERACGSCATMNPIDARFCMACGAALERACPGCGAPAPAEARFCNACGTMIDAESEPLAPERVQTRAPGASLGGQAQARLSGDAVAAHGGGGALEERRMVTVLFADLVGYTSVAERLDHEAVKALTDRCLSGFGGGGAARRLRRPVHRRQRHGRVRRPGRARGRCRARRAGRVGDAGRDGRAQRRDRARRLRVRPARRDQQRRGARGTDRRRIHRRGRRGQRRRPAAGYRQVGAILVGERTRRAIDTAGVYREIGPLTLKGRAQPVAAWEVLELCEGRLRAADRPPTSLVGRRAELAQLLALFERVGTQGAPHLVCVLGEAGIGKTRLMQEFKLRLKRRVPPSHVCHGRCLGFGSGAVYWPLSEMLRAECAITASEIARRPSRRSSTGSERPGCDEDSQAPCPSPGPARPPVRRRSFQRGRRAFGPGSGQCA